VIDADGDISLALLGKLRVAGLTLKQTEALIAKEYVEGGFYTRVDLVVLRCP
jgi:protein involved in polysaccharide export with SLBB domain